MSLTMVNLKRKEPLKDKKYESTLPHQIKRKRKRFPKIE